MTEEEVTVTTYQLLSEEKVILNIGRKLSNGKFKTANEMKYYIQEELFFSGIVTGAGKYLFRNREDWTQRMEFTIENDNIREPLITFGSENWKLENA